MVWLAVNETLLSCSLGSPGLLAVLFVVVPDLNVSYAQD